MTKMINPLILDFDLWQQRKKSLASFRISYSSSVATNDSFVSPFTICLVIDSTKEMMAYGLVFMIPVSCILNARLIFS